MPQRALLEVCVESVEGVIAAQTGGADRAELCVNMLEGGTTPSAGLLALARRQARIPLHAMLRPRGGDFLYSELEFAVMRHDVKVVRDCGVQGIVCGILTEDGRVDRKRMEKLVRLARPLGVTCHRAFDMCRDPFEALEDLIAVGVERVLTSGQRRSAMDGLGVLAKLVEHARGRISIMPGGGIKAADVKTILQSSQAREVHANPAATGDSPMQFRNRLVSMNSNLKPAEYTRTCASRKRVRAFADQVAAAFVEMNQEQPLVRAAQGTPRL